MLPRRRRHEFQRHDAAGPVDADDSGAVVARAAMVPATCVPYRRPAARSGRRYHVARGWILVREYVYDGAFDPGSREIRWRRPQIRHQVGMRIVDARIDDADDVRGRSRRDGPRVGRADVRPRRARRSIDDLSDVVQPPQAREL
jgi:hypothetical protein